MAARQRKAGSRGRVTPKGGPGAGKAAAASAASAKAGASRSPRGLDPDKPVAIGRRPSSPGFLVGVAVMWIAVGVIAFFSLHSGWRLIPAIVAVGIGVLFLRGAGATIIRHERRREEDQS